jgi:hypothetical protein
MTMRDIRARLEQIPALIKAGDPAGARWESLELWWDSEDMTDLPPAEKDAILLWYSLFAQLDDVQGGGLLRDLQPDDLQVDVNDTGIRSDLLRDLKALADDPPRLTP